MAAPNTLSGDKTASVASGPSLPAGTGLVIVAALVIICAGLRTVSSIVAPTFLVLTLVITVQPIRTWLVARKVPRWVASVVVLLAVYALLVVVLGSAVWSLTRLVQELPQYSAQFTDLFNSGLARLSALGVETSALTKAASDINLSSFTGVAQSLLNTVTSGLSLLTLLLVMVFFLVFDGADMTQRLRAIRGQRPQIAEALTEFAASVRKYWSVTTIFGLLVAVINVISLLIIGVPLAVTWGVLAFVTNYIPNIGFLLGLIPPALIALLAIGPGAALAVVIVYSAVNVIVQTLIQPRFTGDAVGITATVAFLSLIFWAFLLGALGALLAVPATLLVKALLVDHSPNGRWLGSFLNAPPPKVTPRRRASKRVASAS